MKIKKIYAVNVNESFVMIQDTSGLIKKFHALLRKEDKNLSIDEISWDEKKNIFVSKRYKDYETKKKENGYWLHQYQKEIQKNNELNILVHCTGRNYKAYRGIGTINSLRVIKIKKGKFEIENYSKDSYSSEWCMGDFLPAHQDNEEFIIPEGIKLSFSFHIPYDGTESYWEKPAVFSGEKKEAKFFFDYPEQIFKFLNLNIQGKSSDIFLLE